MFIIVELTFIWNADQWFSDKKMIEPNQSIEIKKNKNRELRLIEMGSFSTWRMTEMNKKNLKLSVQ